MQNKNIYRAIVGTNSWGSKAYGKVLRGSSVDKQTLKETVSEAMKSDLVIFDTAQDYGLGQGQKLIGELCPKEAVISAKYTPGKKYVSGQVSFHHYPNVQNFFNSVSRVLRPGGRLILRDMTANTDAARWFMNNIEMPVINLAGHGDVHVYGRKEIASLCKNAGLQLELFEKRGFFRLHCAARKPLDQ